MKTIIYTCLTIGKTWLKEKKLLIYTNIKTSNDYEKIYNKRKKFEILPKKNESWFETPSVGTKIDDANLLADALFKVGVDTVGSTRKNPSYDIYNFFKYNDYIVHIDINEYEGTYHVGDKSSFTSTIGEFDCTIT